MKGFPANRLEGTRRPGAVALEDCLEASTDFIFLRTTQASLDSLLSCYDFSDLRTRVSRTVEWLFSKHAKLLIRGTLESQENEPPVFLTVFDGQMRRRMELGLGQSTCTSVSYLESNGMEHLEEGLKVLRVWEQGSNAGQWHEHDLLADELKTLPMVHQGGR